MFENLILFKYKEVFITEISACQNLKVHVTQVLVHFFQLQVLSSPKIRVIILLYSRSPLLIFHFPASSLQSCALSLWYLYNPFLSH